MQLSPQPKIYLEDERFMILQRGGKQPRLKQEEIKWEIMKFFMKIVLCEKIIKNDELGDRLGLEE